MTFMHIVMVMPRVSHDFLLIFGMSIINISIQFNVMPRDNNLGKITKKSQDSVTYSKDVKYMKKKKNM